MKLINIVLTFLIISLIIVSNFDRTYQINREFKSMLSSAVSQEIVSKKYGLGFERLNKLYINENYSRPELSIMRNSEEETTVCITVIKYADNAQAHGNVISSDSTYFRFVFYRIPLLNIDILKRVTPED